MGRVKDLYTFGYTDPRGAFGSPAIKGEGMPVDYDMQITATNHEIEVEFEQEEPNEFSKPDDT